MEPVPKRYACWALAALMLLAMAPWPYSYYQFLRLSTLIVGSVAAVHLYAVRRYSAAAIAAVGAIIFNPIIPLHMEREQWGYFNVVFAIGFLIVGANIKGKR